MGNAKANTSTLIFKNNLTDKLKNRFEIKKL